jgi:hypothetical protein
MTKMTLESVLRGPREIIERFDGGEADAAAMRKVGLYLAMVVVAGAGLYGWSMGIRHSFTQAVASSIKVPLLFLLSLAICLPSLHSVGQLVGLRLRLAGTLGVVLNGMAATSILLASFSPLAVFFLLSGATYSFLLLFHVAVFAVCGYAGIRQTRQGFRLVGSGNDQGSERRVRSVLRVWMVLYMFVGAQLAYTMAPFIGSESTFVLFRYPGGSFVGEVLHALRTLLS